MIVVTREQLEAVAALAPQDQAPNVRAAGGGAFDLAGWISVHHLDVGEPAAWNGGKRWIFRECPFNRDHRDRSAYLLQFASGAVSFGCHHNGCAGNDWHALRDKLEPGWRERRVAKQPPEFDSSTPKDQRVDESNSKPVEGYRALTFAPMSAALAGASETVPYVVDGAAARYAITGFGAREKTGKTTWLFGLLRAFGDGTPYLGMDVQRCIVVLLTEERQVTLAQKRDRWDVGDHVHVLYRHDARGVPWPEVMRQARAYAHQVGAAGIIVDTFFAWSDLEGEQENHSGAMKEAIDVAKEAAEDGFFVWLNCHDNKAGGLRGSTALPADLDIILEMDFPPGEPETTTRRVITGKGRFEETPRRIVCELTDSGYVHLEGDTPTRSAAERERCARALAHGGEGTAEDVGKRIGMAKGTAHRYLQELVLAGSASVHGAGRRGDPFVYRALIKPEEAPAGASEFDSSTHEAYMDESNSRPETCEFVGCTRVPNTYDRAARRWVCFGHHPRGTAAQAVA